MSTARFCRLLDIPERTWRRRQGRAARSAGFSSGPWPRPARDRSRHVVADLARKHPAWGHRKIWAMARHEGHQLTMSTVLRVLRDEGLLLEASYQRQRRAGGSTSGPGSPRSARRRSVTRRPAPTRCGSSTSPTMRPAVAALGGPPGSRTTGRSMSSVGIGPRRPTSTTRSPAWS